MNRDTVQAAAEPHATQGGLAGVMERLHRALGGSVDGSRLTLTTYLYIDVSSTPTMHADGLAEVLVRFAGYPCYGTTVAFAGDDDPKAYRITSVVHAVKSILRVARAAALESKDLDVFSTRVGMDLRELQRRSYNEAVRDDKHVTWAPTDYTMYWNVKNKNQHPSAWRALRAAYETLKQRTAPKVEAAAEPRGAKSSPALGALAQRYNYSESYALKRARRLGSRLLIAYATEFHGNTPGLILGITDEQREKWYMFHIRELPGGIVLRYMYRIKAIYLDDPRITRPGADRPVPRGMLDKVKDLAPDVLLSKAFSAALSYVKHIEDVEAAEARTAGTTAAAEPQPDPTSANDVLFEKVWRTLRKQDIVVRRSNYVFRIRGALAEPPFDRKLNVFVEPTSGVSGARERAFSVYKHTNRVPFPTYKLVENVSTSVTRLNITLNQAHVATPAALLRLVVDAVLVEIKKDTGVSAAAEPDASTQGEAARALLRSLRGRGKHTFFVSNIPVQIHAKELVAVICVGNPRVWHQNVLGRLVVGETADTAKLSVEGAVSELRSTDPTAMLKEVLTELVNEYKSRIKTASASAEPSSLDVTSANAVFDYLRARCRGVDDTSEIADGDTFSVGPVLRRSPQTGKSLGNARLSTVDVSVVPSAAYNTTRPVIRVTLLDRSLILQEAPDDRIGVDRLAARILAAARETVQAGKKARTGAEFATLVQAVGLKYHFFDKFARETLRPAACRYTLPYDPEPQRNFLSASNEIDMLWRQIHGGRTEAQG